MSSLFTTSPFDGTEGGNHAAESRGAADDAKFGLGLCTRSPLSIGFDGFDFDPPNLKGRRNTNRATTQVIPNMAEILVALSFRSTFEPLFWPNLWGQPEPLSTVVCRNWSW